MDGGIGASSKRREDVRFLTGKGRYTDDLNRPGQAYVAFLRSDVAHGRIARLDTAAAAAMPGVLRVFTAADFAGVGGIPCGWQVTDRFGKPMAEPKHPVLAEGKVRHVGDPVAAVEWRDVRRLLDDELGRLPAKWRTPLVLCYLDGLTRDEAARQLGWSLRTLHRRLDEGRQQLREGQERVA